MINKFGGKTGGTNCERFCDKKADTAFIFLLKISLGFCQILKSFFSKNKEKINI